MSYIVLTETRDTKFVSVFRYTTLAKLAEGLKEILLYRRVLNISREITETAPLGGLARLALSRAGFVLNEKDGITP